MKPIGPVFGQNKSSEWTKDAEKLKKIEQTTNIAKIQISWASKILS